jgi:hypothetical protein
VAGREQQEERGLRFRPINCLFLSFESAELVVRMIFRLRNPEWPTLRVDLELEVPIARVFALDDVREAYRQLELRHTRGKLVLRP